MTKLGPVFNFPEILTMIEDYWVVARIDGGIAAQMAKKLSVTPISFSLAHIEPELELFEVWEMMVRQIIITIISDVINNIYNIDIL